MLKGVLGGWGPLGDLKATLFYIINWLEEGLDCSPLYVEIESDGPF